MTGRADPVPRHHLPTAAPEAAEPATGAGPGSVEPATGLVDLAIGYQPGLEFVALAAVF